MLKKQPDSKESFKLAIPPESLEGYSAILGGSFDPVHNGHLHIAREILRLSPISRVIFMPNKLHHFKPDTGRLDFEKRVKLISKAIKDTSSTELWLEDAQGSGYTADLMKRLYEHYPRYRFCFVVGSDNLQNLKLWYDFDWLQENLHFLIIPRPGEEIDPAFLGSIKYSLLYSDPCEVSSTMVRKRIIANESITDLVPAEIEASIHQYYRSMYGI